MDLRLAAMLLLAVAMAPPAWAADDRFGPADLDRIADLAEPDLSPDGEFVVYSVTVTERDADARQSDLWRVRYDGRERVQLTATPAHDESQLRAGPRTAARSPSSRIAAARTRRRSCGSCPRTVARRRA